MNQFSNICGASPVKNQILFFGGHDSHFGYHTLIHMELRNNIPFVLKAGDSINDQPNDNGPNPALKYIYNEVKSAWMLKYGTTIFLPRHMKSILVEA